MLYRRKNPKTGKLAKYFTLKFDQDGKQKQVSTGCTTERAAEIWERNYRNKLALGELGIEEAKPGPTIEAGVADFLDYSAIHNIESTHKSYVVRSKAVLEFFRKVSPLDDLREIDRPAILRFVKWRLGTKKKPPARLLKKNPKAKTMKPIKPATCNREVTFIGTVFNHHIANGEALTNPVTKYKKPKEGKAWTVLTRKEEAAYFAELSQPLLDVATIMIDQGVRPEEIFTLQKREVNFATGKIFFNWDGDEGKTDAATRNVRMTARVRDILKRRIADSPYELVFPGGKNGDSEDPLTKLNAAHHAARERAGLRYFRLYDLRHTFATRFAETDPDLMALKNILGHAHLSMVQRYAHPSEKHNFDAMKRFEESQVAIVANEDGEWPEEIG